ncbi:MAG TPA: serine hydrolase [Steroidobacteraceae bacterium]|nr:serine hydrolase [Steroidobacteraceae bacterium]
MFLRKTALLAAGLLVLYAIPDSARTAGARSPSDRLIGIWGIEQSLGPLVHGDLTLDGRAPQWRASIAGFDVPVQHAGSDVTVVLPDGLGEFRGRLRRDAEAIDGDWVQPAGIVNRSRYATPLHLMLLSRSVWRGDVLPLEDRVSFYVSIQKQPGGSLTAVIINPQYNLFRRRSYDVLLHGSTVAFTNPHRPSDHFFGSYDEAADHLWLPLLDSYPPLPLTRRNRNDAPGFYARAGSASEYRYREPIAEDDGWPTASLTDVGIAEQPLAALIRKILTADPTDNPTDIDSLLIARHGKLVLEEYFHGYDEERPHDMRSASKTFAPVLVGIARHLGIRVGPNTLVYSLFGHDQATHRDGRRDHLTLKDLMTMTSGFACDDNDDSSPGHEDNMQSQSRQRDWYAYTLSLPMAGEPGGTHAVYCSADLNLVGGAVSHATHSWLPLLFDRYLAGPLQFHTYHMNLMPTGEAYMGGGLRLRPRDELKLGELYLSGGIWNGRRIVSNDWVRASTTTHSTFSPQTDYDAPHEYGFGWHINYLHVGERVFRVYSAGGNGGQIVMVIPALDMVVAFNGSSYGEFAKWYRWGLKLVPQYIIPAALGRNSD